jgi:hypothetical protein
MEGALGSTAFLWSTSPRKTIIDLDLQFIHEQPGCLFWMNDAQQKLSEYDVAHENLIAAQVWASICTKIKISYACHE